MISIFLASILCAATPVAAENSGSPSPAVVQTVSNSYELGSDIVQKVRTDYAAGKYSEFLKMMDKDYKKAKSESELEGLIELRTEAGKVNIHPEFIRSYDILQKSKNQDLLDAASSDDSLFGKKVRSAAVSIPAESELLRSLHFKAPSSPDLTDEENAVIDIDLEYYYKSIHLDSLSASGDKISDRKEKQIALEMERMDRLTKASKAFQDKDLKKAIQATSSNLEVRLAKQYDMRDLLALARGSLKPATPLESKAASIVATSQGQVAELHRHLLISLDNDQPISETVQN